MEAPLMDHARRIAVRPRKSRVSHSEKIDALRTTLAALERALPVMLTLDGDSDACGNDHDHNHDDDDDHEEDGRWHGFLDTDALRVRRLMRQSLWLTKEAHRLTTARTRLRHLLQEHRLASRVVAGLAQAHPVDTWDASVERWQALAHAHFQPWTLDECDDEIAAALKEVHAFQWRVDTQTTGATFFGWRDERRVLHFQFHKTFRDDDVQHYVDCVWATYADARLFQNVVIGPRARATLTVLQQLGPDTAIAIGTQRNPAIAVDVHMLFIVFRVKVADVITMCVRSIRCPALIKALDGPSDVWSSNCVWTQWEPLETETIGYKFRTGGSIGGIDVNYANQWMWEVFGAVLRTERYGKGRDLITST